MIDIILASFVLWLMFLPTAALIHRQRVRPITNPRGKAVALLWSALFVLYDGFFNFTYAALIFLEPGHFSEPMFTQRLQRYLRTKPDTWRGKLAIFICLYLIEPWDWNHCGLASLQKYRSA